MTPQENLELQIKTYDANYRAGTPLCSDTTFDLLVEELKSKYPNSELLKNGVIRQEVVTRKQKLPIPMYSLNKCKTVEEVKKWLRNIGGADENDWFILTPKFDGISLVVDESNLNAWTRGDGEFGQNSSTHLSKMKVRDRNDQLDNDINSFSYGEAIMSKKNFEKYKDRYANPRNLVAGLFGRDEASDELKDVSYIRYGLSSVESLPKAQQLLLCWSYSLDHQCIFKKITVRDITTEFLDATYKEWSEIYHIDGLVIDVDCERWRKELGREENNNPKYARAIKLQQWTENVDVPIVGHTLNISKQGKLKGTITIPPTEIGGVEVTNVTFYNAKFLADFCLNVGRNVTVKRSGDVIPKIVAVEGIAIPQKEDFVNQSEFELALGAAKESVLKKVGLNEVRKSHAITSVCPSCGNPMVWDETYTERICTNPDCEEMKISKLVHFFTTLEIEEFGEPSIRRFYEAGFKTIRDIIWMTPDEMMSIDGFGLSSATKIRNQFDKLIKDGVPLARLLHASDVFEGKIGEKTAQLILDNISSEKLPYIASQITIAELAEIEGVGETTAQIFLIGYRRFLSNQNSGVFIATIQSKKVEVTGNKYAGMKICFSGVRPSKEKEQEILSQGGEIVNGVSNKTTHLVVKDLSSTSSKTVKARQLGIEILTMQNL